MTSLDTTSSQLIDLQRKLETAKFAYTGAREKNKQFEQRIAELQLQLEKAEARRGGVDTDQDGQRDCKRGLNDPERTSREEKGGLEQVERERDEWETRYWRLRNGVDGILESKDLNRAPESAPVRAKKSAVVPRKSSPPKLPTSNRADSKKRKTFPLSDTESSEGLSYAHSTASGKMKNTGGSRRSGGAGNWNDMIKKENTAIISSSFNKARREAYAMRHLTPPRDLPYSPWDADLQSRYFVRLIVKPESGVQPEWLRGGKSGRNLESSRSRDKLDKVHKALEDGLVYFEPVSLVDERRE
ncbi:hypothetical protein IAR50_002567 [Cryptococcus sp. DSM 104548]